MSKFKENTFKSKMGKRIHRRIVISGLLKASAVALLGWHIRKLQIEDSEDYKLLADANRVNLRLIPPSRGLIFDRLGKPIAVNEQNYKVVLIREQANNPSKVLTRLSNIIDLDQKLQDKILQDMKKRSSFIPITVAENLTWDEFAKISVNLPSLPGIIPEVGLTRHYKEYETYAHVVGYVGPISDKDLKSEKPVDPVLQIPKFQIGKVGIEKKLERHLRGSAGVSRVEVNASGRVMRELNRAQGKSGENIHLTIETNLQKFSLERLNGMSASAVLIDIDSGDILSLVSTPSYNPNNFVLGIS